MLLLMMAILNWPMALFSQIPKIQETSGHTGAITKTVFSADGEYLLSAGDDGKIFLWNGRNFKRLFRFGEDHIKSAVKDIDFDLMGKRVIGSADQVYIWQRDNGQLLKTFNLQVKVVDFSPDGRFLLVGNQLLRADNYQLIDTLPAPIQQADFSINGQFLSASSGPMLSLWALPENPGDSLKLIKELNAQNLNQAELYFPQWASTPRAEQLYYPNGRYYLSALAFSSKDGSKIAFGDLYLTMHGPNGQRKMANGSLFVWNTSTNEVEQHWFDPREYQGALVPLDMVYNPIDEVLIIGGSEWSAQSAKGELNVIAPFYRMAVLNLQDNQMHHAVTSMEYPIINTLALRPDGQVMVKGSDQLYSIRLGPNSDTPEVPDFSDPLPLQRKEKALAITHLELMEGDQTLVLGAEETMSLYLIDLSTGQQQAHLPLLPLAEIEREIHEKELHIDQVKYDSKSQCLAALISSHTFNDWEQPFISLNYWNLSTNKHYYFPRIIEYTHTGSLTFTPDGAHLIVKHNDRGEENGLVHKEEIYRVWETATGKNITGLDSLQRIIPFPANWPAPWQLQPDQSKSTPVSINGNQINYQASPKSSSKVFNGHTGGVNSAIKDQEGKYLYSSSQDQSTKIWDAKTGEELASLAINKNAELLIKTTEGYYMGSSKMMQSVSFIFQGKYYNFEQFDPALNRPDKVLPILPYADPKVIKAYEKAYQKRLEKMGLTNANVVFDQNVPEIVFDSEIPFQITSPELNFKIEAQDAQHPITELNVRVNGIPIPNLKNAIAAPAKDISKEIRLLMAEGNNRVQVSVQNEKGVPSQILETIVNYQPTSPQTSDVYLVAIGVSTFQNSEMNLNYAAKDARDLVQLFQSKPKWYGTLTIDTLLNEQVTQSNIKKLRAHLSSTKVNDRVIIFVATHGTFDRDFNYYLATHDTDFSKPKGTALAYEDLTLLLAGIPARQKLILMDACHAGEVDKSNVKKEKTKPDTVATNNSQGGSTLFRSVGTNQIRKKRIGLENSFSLMKQLFADLRQNDGTMVIAAAGGSEFAREGGEFQNGVFTYSLLEALKTELADGNEDGNIDINELQTFLSRRVPELTEGQQQPAFRAENLDNNWALWQIIPPENFDLHLWTQAGETHSIEAYESYLKTYSNGRYVENAQGRIEQIKREIAEQERRANEARGTVTDPDGQVYQWKEMADGKKWMTENLNYRIKEPSIYFEHLIKDNVEGQGWFYRYHEAIEICQALGPGWRLPSDEDWKKLFGAYGGGYMEVTQERGYNAVGDAGHSYQVLTEGGESGLSLVMGGIIAQGYHQSNIRGYYWTSTPADFQGGYPSRAWRYGFIGDEGIVSRVPNDVFQVLLSCRCVKD